jgi:hypothetical protein
MQFKEIFPSSLGVPLTLRSAVFTVPWQLWPSALIESSFSNRFVSVVISPRSFLSRKSTSFLLISSFPQETSYVTKCRLENLMARDHLGDLVVDVNIFQLTLVP